MRCYVPIRWTQLAELHAAGELPGPLKACTVDPRWRAGAPEVDEEEWEFEAQTLAAGALTDMGGGVVLALDLPDRAGTVPDGSDPIGTVPTATVPDDGRISVPGPIRRADLAAILTEDLAWFGVQEIADLLSGR
jgi:hypothetical protein